MRTLERISVSSSDPSVERHDDPLAAVVLDLQFATSDRSDLPPLRQRNPGLLVCFPLGDPQALKVMNVASSPDHKVPAPQRPILERFSLADCCTPPSLRKISSDHGV
jgi:hypothetical protein